MIVWWMTPQLTFGESYLTFSYRAGKSSECGNMSLSWFHLNYDWPRPKSLIYLMHLVKKNQLSIYKVKYGDFLHFCIWRKPNIKILDTVRLYSIASVRECEKWLFSTKYSDKLNGNLNYPYVRHAPFYDSCRLNRMGCSTFRSHYPGLRADANFTKFGNLHYFLAI